ncbi:epoxide hydrolase family protein [Hymenobacter cellulosivorans]|uniref:Epoxide hydrolase n=1 Tax=Hymenobacter cellulosivorans TaxID=2932249 RepID=A0ABY4F8D9_9BACT|nr:epoxide hydrolase family protein [Hymenobacter cellulosivorans]UOQ52912.1 epoxide hydrolase [Hymenobacter cellulosivorans]
MQPFSLNIPQATLDDLKSRLANTRWPADSARTDWQLGTSPAYLRELADYWLHRFDWRQQEARLNQFAHFRTSIDGTELHFIHERGRGPRPLPLLLGHGWPDSFASFAKLIPLLTDPAAHGGRAEDAFDVVVPSLPGFGFSAPLPPTGSFMGQTAARFRQLMTDTLGYPRYAVHGSDVGSGVAERLALDFPHDLLGLHMTGVPYMRLFVPPTDPSAEEQAFLGASQQWMMQEAAYSMVQGGKPDTLAPALQDSPTGLAAWIVEKFRTWSDCCGNLETCFTKDELLTNLTIYWATETIGSSFVPYHQADAVPQGLGAPRIEVPTGFVLFAQDLLPAPRAFAERFYNVQHWTEYPHGGHFAALEQPEALAESLRTFFRPLR